MPMMTEAAILRRAKALCKQDGKNWALEFTLPLPPGTTIRLKAFSMTRAVMNMWCAPETSWRARAVIRSAPLGESAAST
jgi:hypothetical protein